MTPQDVKKYVPGVKHSLTGYTSTSTSFEVAHEFAMKKLEEPLVPVVFEINFKGSIGLFKMTYDITAFPGEDEVLIQDGFEYLIVDNIEKAIGLEL